MSPLTTNTEWTPQERHLFRLFYDEYTEVPAAMPVTNAQIIEGLTTGPLQVQALAIVLAKRRGIQVIDATN